MDDGRVRKATEQELIADHIRYRGVTRCPTAIVGPVEIKLSASDVEALNVHRVRMEEQWASRWRKTGSASGIRTMRDMAARKGPVNKEARVCRDRGTGQVNLRPLTPMQQALVDCLKAATKPVHISRLGVVIGSRSTCLDASVRVQVAYCRAKGHDIRCKPGTGYYLHKD